MALLGFIEMFKILTNSFGWSKKCKWALILIVVLLLALILKSNGSACSGASSNLNVITSKIDTMSFSLKYKKMQNL